MTDSAERLEQARELVAAGREQDAIEALRALLLSSDDPHVADHVHTAAVEAHAASRGFMKIEWQRLAFDAGARMAAPTG